MTKHEQAAVFDLTSQTTGHLNSEYVISDSNYVSTITNSDYEELYPLDVIAFKGYDVCSYQFA